SGYYDAYYKKAQQVRSLIEQDYRRAFEKCDIIATPTAPTAAFRIGEKSDDPLAMYLSDIYTVTMNLAGVPGVSVPCGVSTSALPEEAQRKALEYVESLERNEAFEKRAFRSVLGILADRNVHISKQDIADVRREALRNFPREEPN